MFGRHNRLLALALGFLLNLAACASAPKTAQSPARESSKPKQPAAAGKNPEASNDRYAQALADIAAAVQSGVEAALVQSKSREEAALTLMQLLPGSVRAQKIIGDILAKYAVKPDELQQYLDSHSEAQAKFEADLERISRAASASRNLPSLSEKPGGCDELLQLVVSAKEADEQAARGAAPLLAPCRGKVDERKLLCAISAANRAEFDACARGEREPAPVTRPPVAAALPAPWQTNLDNVGQGKPALLVFCAAWAGPCVELWRNVLAQPPLLQALERDFVAVYVDVTREQDPAHDPLLKRFNVSGVPTLLITDRRGKVIDRTLDYIALDALLARLAKYR